MIVGGPTDGADSIDDALLPPESLTATQVNANTRSAELEGVLPIFGNVSLVAYSDAFGYEEALCPDSFAISSSRGMSGSLTGAGGTIASEPVWSSCSFFGTDASGAYALPIARVPKVYGRDHA
ncbi:MAG: hypothetical protein ABR548_06800 [Actinomycetota bacterium]